MNGVANALPPLTRYPYIDGTENTPSQRGYLLVCGPCLDADEDGTPDLTTPDLDTMMGLLVAHVRAHGEVPVEPSVIVRDDVWTCEPVTDAEVRASFERAMQEATA